MRRTTKSLQYTAVLSIIVASFAFANDGKGDALNRLLEEYNKLNKFNGTVLVAKGGKVLLKRGLGYASLEWKIPNNPETKLGIGSITKTFTAVLIMQLVDEGRLSLRTKLSEALPWYRKDVGDKVTIRHLLNHTSGIPNYFTLFGGAVGFAKGIGIDPVNKEEFARKYCQGDLEFEPGSKWAYNNSGYFLLGLIVERYAAAPYHVVLQKKVFDKTGMTRSGDLAPDQRTIVEGMASGYVKSEKGLQKENFWNLSTSFAAGSMYSTVEDLLHFDQALYGSLLVSDESKKEMFTPGANSWGCGWELRQAPVGYNNQTLAIQTHEGFLFSWHSRIYRIPQDMVTVIILSNTGDSPLEQMFKGVTDVLYDRVPVYPKRSIAEAVDAEFRVNGIEKAVQLYRELRSKEPSSWDFGERELNALGYRYLRGGAGREAVQLFKLNVEAYPNVANLFDSYGEGLAAIGRIDDAIMAYEKALALDPGTPNAKTMIEKLKAQRSK
jgi:CubicO group peptidase (beta-lactamase class C family)